MCLTRGFTTTSLLTPTLFIKISLILTMVVVWFLYKYNILNEVPRYPVDEAYTKEFIELIPNDSKYAESYRKSKTKHLKYILVWNEGDYSPFLETFRGQRRFLNYNCSFSNCFITADETLLGDVTKFDAVAFNGRYIEQGMRFPTARSPHQKYIYFNLESEANYPVCSKKFEGYFNWTATYKLDSDIPWTYLLIKDKLGRIVGPKKDMIWKDNMSNYSVNKWIDKFPDKTRAAAWFSSNCQSKSNREQFVNRLKESLKTYNLEIDVYGSCGNLNCPRNQHKICEDMLKKQYYFYMSLENSFSDDYVTEKLLTALNNYVVPVVFGGANYSRFLPPDSYINGLEYHSDTLAQFMNQLINSPVQYYNYFRWRDTYRYEHGPNLCQLCTALNNKTKVETRSVYDNFRNWWSPKYADECAGKSD